jgi:hypothetical protein
MKQKLSKTRARCVKKFLYYFPKGFNGQKYIDWERDYKWQAHLSWCEALDKKEFKALLEKEEFEEIVGKAVRIESRTNLLFSFEKMALRDGIKGVGAELFAKGLYQYVYGSGAISKRFQAFSETLASLPRKQTRVLTWPLQTVFSFIAKPNEFIFLKPRVTQLAAKKYDFDFIYKSKPNWETYQSYLDFAERVRMDIAWLKPRDMIDVQSFIWVLGSEEYPD